MIRRLYFTAALLLTCLYCAGQKQITQFDNRINPNGLNVIYRGQVNGKLLFSSFSPKTGNELWTSDGTKAKTRLLKDITPGNGDTGPYDFTNIGGQLYFVVNNNELWRTDGTTAGTRKMLRSDSVLNLHVIDNRLLASFRDWSTGRVSFGWVGEPGQADLWGEDATTFTVAAGKLYYGLYDSTAKKWTLKVYDKKAFTLFSQANEPLTAIKVENYNGYEYFSLRASYEQHTFLVSNANRTEAARKYDWGTGWAPAMLRDAAGKLFLIDDGRITDYDRPLKVYKVVEGHNWETLADIKSSMMYANTPTGSEGPFHTNFAIEGNIIAFTTLYGYESVYTSYLNVFNFKTNQKKVSSKLPDEMRTREMTVRPGTGDIHEISNAYAKCTYDIAADKVVSLETVSPDNAVTVGKNRFEFSDNLYAVSGGVKRPLLESSKIFAQKSVIYRTTLNDKMLFWTNDEQTGTGKVWASDGEKTEEVLSYTGVCYFWNTSAAPARVGQSVVFASVTSEGFRVYKTDGTPAGSKELHAGKTDTAPYIEKIIANERQAAVEIMSQYKSAVVVTDLTTANEFDITNFKYHSIRATSRNIYVLNTSVKAGYSYEYIYKVDGAELKPFTLNKDGDDAINPQFAGDRIYYTLRSSSGSLRDVCYSPEGSDAVTRIHTGETNNAFLVGNYLIVMGPGNEAGLYNTKIFNPANAKLISSFERMYPAYVQSGNLLGLWGPFNAAILDGEQVNKYTFSDAVDYLREVPNGMLIKLKAVAGPSWHYFNREQRKVTPVFKNENLEYISSGPAGELLFGGSMEGAQQVLWQSNGGKRTDLGPGFIVYKVLNGSLLLAIKNANYEQKSIYSIGRNSLVEHYPVHAWTDIVLAGSGNYTLVSGSDTGEELARAEQDSLHRLPEIIKGPEGIMLQEVFQFKNDMFAIAFTWSKGLQVWKLNALPDGPEPEEEEEINVDTPEFPGRVTNLPDNMQLNAYPNPVIRELNIDLKEGGVIKIVDAKGFEVLKAAAGKAHTIDMKDLPAGQYIVIYAGPKGNVFKKVIKL